MFQTLRSRLIFIAFLVIAAGYGIWPRQRIDRREVGDGVFVVDTVRAWNIKRGLDIQGGMHLAVEIDQSGGPIADPEDALTRALEVISSRIDEFGVQEPIVQRSGNDRIIIQLAGLTGAARAKQIVQRSAFLEFRITDMDNRFLDALPRIDLALARAGVRAPTGAGQAATTSPLSDLFTAVDSTGDSTQSPGDSATSDAGGAEAQGSARAVFSGLLANQGEIPGEYFVPVENVLFVDSLMGIPEFERAVPFGLDVRWGTDTLSIGGRPYRTLYAVQNQPMLTGEDLSDAQAQIDPTFNQAVVNFQLNRAGGRIFARETARNIDNFMAIMLDGRVRGRPPVIRSQIRRNGQIELGNATMAEAQDLAIVLRAGALPAPIVIVEERTVGPSLGEDSIRRGRTAGIVAIALVVLIMAVYYRGAGLVAISALGFYVLFSLGGLGMLEATLTLPGLAGFVLSVGLAVDANVLIFERIREELGLGKSPRIAVDAGFENAMPAIIDANVTTAVMALFLFQFGTGAVKGFAVTLLIGIVASFLTAIFVTRTIFLIWLQRRTATTELSI